MALPLTHSNIIDLLGVESLPLKKRKEIVEEAVGLVEARVLGRILEKLEESEQREFNEKLKSENHDAVSDFLAKNNIDVVSFVEEETERVKKELLDIAEEDIG